MKHTPLGLWYSGQACSVVLGGGLGYGLGDGLSAWMIGLASMFLLMLLVDIRQALAILITGDEVLK